MKLHPFFALRSVVAGALIFVTLGFPGMGRASGPSAPPVPPQSPAQSPPIQKELPPVGVPAEQAITPGQTHLYTVKLTAGQAFAVTVRKKGVAISLKILDATEQPLILAETQTGLNGDIPVGFIPRETGDYRLEVASEGLPDSPARAYTMSVEPFRAPTARDQALMTLWEGLCLADRDHIREAARKLEAAVTDLRNAKAEDLFPDALFALGQATRELGKLRSSQIFLNDALDLYRKRGIDEGELVCLNALAETCLAQENYAQARELGQVVVHRRRTATPLNAEQLGIALYTFGTYHKVVGDFSRADELMAESLEIAQQLNHRQWIARSLCELSEIKSLAHDAEPARVLAEKALRAFRDIGSRKGEALALRVLADVHVVRLTLDPTLDPLKVMDISIGLNQQAIEIFRELGMTVQEAVALNSLAVNYQMKFDPDQAREMHRRAIELIQDTEFTNKQLAFIANLATMESDEGNHETALAEIRKAVAMVESARDRLGDTSSRTAFSNNTIQRVYEAYTLVYRMYQRAHRRHPELGYNVRALEVMERGRARTLVELLNSRKQVIREGLDRRLLDRVEKARKELDEKSQALGRGENDPARAKQLKVEYDLALAEYEAANQELEKGSPGYGQMANPKPLTLPEIQKLLDPDMILVAYDVQETTLFTWVVTPTGMEAYRGIGRVYLERYARQFYDAIAARGRSVNFETPEKRAERIAEADKEFEKASYVLSIQLLIGVGKQAIGKRVIFIPDEILHYIPFGALTMLGTDQYLATQCEITVLPSIGTLAAIRQNTDGRAPSPKTVAVWADPVFAPNDLRVKSGKDPISPNAVETDAQRSATDVDGADRSWPLRRLPGSRKEAKAIAALVPPDQCRLELDFNASRQNVLKEDLGQYRFLHFATHGFINNIRPELSGLALSMVNRKGEPSDGFLHASDVFRMKLPVEMVVLSGCRTGLGQVNANEGMIGMTRAFMYAGAARVMVSLWSVSDESTSVLMTEMYRGMLGKEKLRPSAALREAQLKMMKDKRWSAPFYWASFVIQGEPR
jgi:CHAT domain-containing protein/lipopolysaccharide biosynthesis regulator YciM